MADIAKLREALVNADRAAASGDPDAANDARALAAEIRRLGSGTTEQAASSGIATTAENAARIKQGLPPVVEDSFSRKYDPNTSLLKFAGNKIGMDLAGIGEMGRRVASGYLPYPLNQELERGTSDTTRRVLNILGVDPKLKPPGPVADFAANAASDALMNFALPGGSTAVKIVGGVGSTIGRETGKGVGPGGEVVGSVVGAVIAPAALFSRLPVLQAAWDVKNLSMGDVANKLRDNPQFMARVKEDVLNTLAKDLRENPDVFRKSFAEAQALEQAIPGLRLNLAQRFASPEIVAQQRNVDVGTRNRAAQLRSGQDAALKGAMQESPSARAMAEGAIEDVTQSARQRVSGLSDQIAAKSREAEQLSLRANFRVDTEDLGERALAIRQDLLGQARGKANALMNDATSAATKVDAKFDPMPIVDRASELRKQPVWDDANFPSIFTKVEQWGNLAKEGSVSSLPFEGIRDMRQAVNADIAGALKSNSPNARAQLHNLRELRNSIDDVIESSPYDDVKAAYGKFNEYYRREFAPRFLRGVNLAAERSGVRGDPILPGEKVFEQYLKPGGATNMARYIRLYGENVEAMDAMRKAVVDRYAREVIDASSGQIQQNKHAAFFDKYKQPLSVLERQGFNFADRLRDTGKAFDEVVSTRLALEEEVKRINSDAALRLFRDDFGAKSPEELIGDALKDTRRMRAALSRVNDSQARGIADFASDFLSREFQDAGRISSEKIRAFLADPNRSRAYTNAMARAHGGDVATEHLKTLRRVADAVDRINLTPVPPLPTVSAAAERNPFKDDMQKKIGLSNAVIGNMMRAVVAGRVSPEWAGVVLGGQAFKTIEQNLKNEVYKQVVSDPATATKLLDLMNTPATSVSMAQRVKDLLKKSPAIASYLIGLKEYPRLGAQATVNLVRDQQEEALAQ